MLTTHKDYITKQGSLCNHEWIANHLYCMCSNLDIAKAMCIMSLQNVKWNSHVTIGKSNNTKHKVYLSSFWKGTWVQLSFGIPTYCIPKIKVWNIFQGVGIGRASKWRKAWYGQNATLQNICKPCWFGMTTRLTTMTLFSIHLGLWPLTNYGISFEFQPFMVNNPLSTRLYKIYIFSWLWMNFFMQFFCQ
jgi:hypothetical protein